MSLSLHTITSKTKFKKKKRLGRGNGSGDGNYSGRGIKGQGARAGVTGLKMLGIKNLVKQTPKLRGDKSYRPNNQVIDFSVINKNFKDNEEITIEKLFKLKLIKRVSDPVKILNNGELTIRGITVEKKIKISAKAREQLNLK